MCLVIEGKKTRMVKNAIPVMQTIKTNLGRDQFVRKCADVLSKELQEEHKDQDVAKKDVEQRVERIMAVVEPPLSKVDKSKDFRSFLKAQAETKKPE